jgi:acyl-CoA thioester hydrolase
MSNYRKKQRYLTKISILLSSLPISLIPARILEVCFGNDFSSKNSLSLSHKSDPRTKNQEPRTKNQEPRTKNQEPMTNLLSTIEFPVRFSEVDSMQIVWHGHYVKYMEEGREDFGRKYGINYMLIKAKGYMAPLVKLTCEFKKTVSYDDKVIVETRFVDSDAAKITYTFRIFRVSDQELVATGESVQVFLDMNSELVLTIPPFFDEWKKKWGLR